MRDHKWDRHFLGQAFGMAKMSKDPRTKVGAVLVRDQRFPIMQGYNGFPEGFEDTPERLNDRDFKLDHVVHAEQNVISLCARHGIRTQGTTLFIAATDDSGAMWGGPPCIRCAVSCVQAGIQEIVAYPTKPSLLTNWAESLEKARRLLYETGIIFRTVPFSGQYCTIEGETMCHNLELIGNRCSKCPLDENLQFKAQ